MIATVVMIKSVIKLCKSMSFNWVFNLLYKFVIDTPLKPFNLFSLSLFLNTFENLFNIHI